MNEATVLDDGRVRTSNGGAFDTPSRAAMDTLDRGSWNGWTFAELRTTTAGAHRRAPLQLQSGAVPQHLRGPPR
jgi:hypothetical protein